MCAGGSAGWFQATANALVADDAIRVFAQVGDALPAILHTQRLVVLILQVQVLERGEVLDRGGHVSIHLVVVEVERDEIHQVSQGVQLRQVEVQLVVLHAELTKPVQLAYFSRDGAREIVLKHVELLQRLRGVAGGLGTRGQGAPTWEGGRTCKSPIDGGTEPLIWFDEALR